MGCQRGRDDARHKNHLLALRQTSCAGEPSGRLRNLASSRAITSEQQILTGEAAGSTDRHDSDVNFKTCFRAVLSEGIRSLELEPPPAGGPLTAPPDCAARRRCPVAHRRNRAQHRQRAQHHSSPLPGVSSRRWSSAPGSGVTSRTEPRPTRHSTGYQPNETSEEARPVLDWEIKHPNVGCMYKLCWSG